MHRDRRRDEQGATLVEVLVAVVILGIAGVAVSAGLMLTVKASDIHRKETTGGAYVRSLAEAIQLYALTNYKPCAAAGAYLVASVNAAVDLPTGYTATQEAARSVGANGVAAGGCASDTGIQQVTVHVASTDARVDEKLVILVRKPCDASAALCS